jgi:NAD(P)-dependent dehydrogenase (short-subunit alcohol dehydrogenase family)
MVVAPYGVTVTMVLVAVHRCGLPYAICRLFAAPVRPRYRLASSAAAAAIGNLMGVMTACVTFHDLVDASVFITGGGAGIGAALTEGFLAQGARVAFVQRSDASAFCDALEERCGRRPLFLACDISDTTALRAAVERAAERHGPVRVLVNNAANDERHRAEDVTEAYWSRNLAINLSAYFFAAQAVAPSMKAAGGGSIVNFSSISYMIGNAGYPAYATANAGITGMTRALAREFGPDGIRVNGLAPGWVMTERQRRLWATPSDIAAHVERQCLKRTLEPGDVVPGALFLASGASRMMTGQTVVIDGGVAFTG